MKIRESAQNGRLDLEEELHAFVEDRRQHVADLINPALASGKTVILDRYYYSTIAYQGARGADVERTKVRMMAIAPPPDAVLLLNLPVPVALSRIANGRGEKPNKFEEPESLAHVQKIFVSLSRELPNIHVIDGSQSISAVRLAIAQVLIDGALRSKRCAKSYGCDVFYCTEAKLGQCRWFKIQHALRHQTV